MPGASLTVEDSVLLVQLTDSHLFAEADGKLLGMNTCDSLEQVVELAIDEQPRIIAVDEVYRLMRHPSLLDFLIEAAKTFRTRRKKVLMVDQSRR